MVFLGLIGFLASCGGDSKEKKEEVEKKKGMVTYKLTLTSLWDSDDHKGRPPGAHFSPLVISLHKKNYALFPKGELTRPALEPVAELGATGEIEKELKSETSKGTVEYFKITKNQSVPKTPVQTHTFEVFSTEASFFSFVSMIAPSPDWVIGVDSLSLLDDQGDFIEDTEDIELFAYNAGTEEGDTAGNFSIENEPTANPTPIERLSGDGFEKPFAVLRLEKVD